MKVWTSTENIWWNNASEDKPSRAYFLQFENRLDSNDNVKVEFISYKNVKIVSKLDNVTYLKVEHNSRTYYYYVTGVNRVTNGGYELNLEIDVFASFTLPFLNNLYDNQTIVRSTRNMEDSDNRLFYTDSLLDDVPISYDSVKFEKRQFKNDGDWWYQYNNFQIKKTNNTVNPCIYYRFNQLPIKLSTGETAYIGNVFLPMLAVSRDGTSPTNTKIKINNGETNVYNTQYILNYMYENDFVSEFDGIYILPNALNFQGSTFNIETKAHGKIQLFKSDIGFNTTIETLWLPQLDMLPLTPNSLFLCDKQMLQYMDIKYFDNNLKPEFWGYTSSNEFLFNMGDVKVTFAGAGYLNFKTDKLTLSDTQMTLPYKLPSWNNEYFKYVQQSYNTVNTSYQIAKQNAIKNTIFGGLGLAGGIASGLTGGFGVGMGIGMGASALSSIGGGWVSLSQKRKQIQAQYADARRKLQPTITPSNIEDNKFTRYLLDNDYYEGVEVTHLSKSTISQMSTILYYYGYFNPQMNRTNYLLDLKRDNKFTFISLEQEYTKNLLNNFNGVFKEFHIDVINDLSGGIRLWDRTPNY